jgi:hypothetical protein
MPPLLWAVFWGILLIALLSGLSRRFERLKRSYYFGVNAWGHWLPVFATGLYLAVLVVNLAAAGELADHTLALGHVLKLFELIFLLMIGPLFLTRWGNAIAALALVYFAQRVLMQADDPLAATNFAAAHLILASTTVVAVLGDKMPWLSGDRVQGTANKLREILLIFLCVGALGVTATGMIKFAGFTRWFNGEFGLGTPAFMMLGILTAMFAAWLSVVLGFTRHFMMPVITLPSTLVLAYITGWPPLLMIVPFIASLALSLATADRRIERTRRQTAYRQTLAMSR